MARLNAFRLELDRLVPPDPVPHSADSRYYRVVVIRTQTGKHGTEYVYHIWPGWGIRRDFVLNELPEEIKKHLTLVMGNEVSARRGVFYDMDYVFELGGTDPPKQEISMTVFSRSFTLKSHPDPYPEEFSTIGWRVSKNIFCLVLTAQCLSSLRGETISNDTGRQGQEESP